MLKERAAENAALVEKAYGGGEDDPDEEVWTGISPDTHETEQFEDEEHLTTVTVVEDFDPDTLIHGPALTERGPDPTRESGKRRTRPPGSELDKRKSSRSKKVRHRTHGALKLEK